MNLLLLAAALVAAPAPAADLPAVPAVLESARRGAAAMPTPVGTAVPAGPVSAAPELPSEFFVYGRFFSLTNTFDLYALDDLTKLGTLTEHFFSLTKTFDYVDAGKTKVAAARSRFWALGSTVDVTDGAGRPIGTIKEDVLRSFLKTYTRYHIRDSAGKDIAVSEKLELFSTEIVLRAPDGRVVAELRRDFLENLLRVTDKWRVKIHDASVVDSRMIVVIAAYKSAIDNDRRAEEAAKSLLKDDDK